MATVETRRPLFSSEGYAQHGGCEWWRSYCLRYRTYLLSENHDLLDFVPFAYEGSTHVGFTADALSLKEVTGTGKVDEVVEHYRNESSEDSDGKNLQLSKLMLETASISEDD